MGSLQDKRIILGVSGGIAAYKACEILRWLSDEGADVHVILTEAAQKFVTPLTFQSLSKNPVHTDLFSLTQESEMSHIQLADQADGVLIAPATADLIARLACGMANDLLTTVALVTRAPILLAPSMNVNMWEKEVVQTNLQILKNRGLTVLEPDEGYLACGWIGKGRLADVPWIVEQTAHCLTRPTRSPKKKSFQGKKILINAGPTREYLDPVRFISNPSSGRMGFALAKAAQRRGARVTLVSGPVSLPTPEGVRRIDVESAEEMFQACQKEFPDADVFIASAAVGDYRPSHPHDEKLKKTHPKLNLELKTNPDILKTLGEHKKNGQILVGFAAETQDLIDNAQSKIKKKNLDLIVANDVSQPGAGFAVETNQVILINRQGQKKPLPLLAKEEVAENILDQVEILFKARSNE